MAKKTRPSGFGYDNGRVGWYVFPETAGEVAKYGNLYLKWEKPYGNRMEIHLSINAGKVWVRGARQYDLAWQLNYQASKYGSGLTAQQGDVMTEKVFAPIQKARDAYAKQYEEKLAAMTPEERLSLKKERQERLLAKREKETGENSMQALNCLVEVGPQFIKLKDQIDQAVSLMSVGGIDKPIPYHERKLVHLRDAIKLLEKYVSHMKKCQTRTGRKKK